MATNYLDRITRLEARLKPVAIDPMAREKLFAKLDDLASRLEPGPVRLTPNQAKEVRSNALYHRLFEGIDITEDPNYEGSIAAAFSSTLDRE